MVVVVVVVDTAAVMMLPDNTESLIHFPFISDKFFVVFFFQIICSLHPNDFQCNTNIGVRFKTSFFSVAESRAFDIQQYKQSSSSSSKKTNFMEYYV